MSVLTFPVQPIIEKREALKKAFAEMATANPGKNEPSPHVAWIATLPAPVPALRVVKRMSSFDKWRVTRAIQADDALSGPAVLVAVHLMDWWHEKGGFSAPSAAKLATAARLVIGPERRPDISRLERVVAELVQRGWFRHEFHEHKKGSGFPGRKFLLTADLQDGRDQG